MWLKFIVLVVSLVVACNIRAAEQVDRIAFIGRYASMVITPEPPTLPPRIIPGTQIEETIVSNNCANAVINFAIEEVLYGSARVEIQIAKSLGEWCKLPMPLGGGRVLVSAEGRALDVELRPRTPNARFNRRLVNTYMQMDYKPGRRMGRAITAPAEITLIF
jgi:hypothetical protein